MSESQTNESKDNSSNNSATKPEIKQDGIEEEKQQSQNNVQLSKIERMDRNLCIYYQKLGFNDYCKNNEQIGKFGIWCDENGYDDEILEGDFNGSAEEAECVDFDPKFPFKDKINPNEKAQKIFEFLKSLFDERAQLNIKEFNLNVTQKQMEETQTIYQNNIKTWGTDGNSAPLQDNNILYGLTVSRMDANQNLLLNVIDAFKRDIVYQQIQHKQQIQNNKQDKDVTEHKTNPEQERIDTYISDCPFLKKLNESMKKQIIVMGPTATRIDLDLASILKAYPNRIGARLSPMGCRLINGDLKLISKYIIASTKFIDQLLNFETKQLGGPPFLFDFIVLVKPSVSDEVFDAIDHRPANVNDDDNSDDDDDGEQYIQPADDSSKIEYKEDIIGDVIKDLNANKCVLHAADIKEETKDEEIFEQLARTTMTDAFREIRGKIQNKITGTYPQNCRFNTIIDTRKEMSEDDTLIMFQPPKGCNKLSDVILPESYFDLSRQCLIPRPGYKAWDEKTADDKIEETKADKEQTEKLKTQTIDATKVAQGQILTFSYHVWAADQIKCYFLWNGTCHRFYPQDILEILPHLFIKSKENIQFAKSDEAKRLIWQMEITDTKFANFYRGLHRLNEYEFPKQYHVPKRVFNMENPVFQSDST